MVGKDLETVSEVIAELDEIVGIYKAIFDELKFAYRCLIRSILDETEEKVEKIKTLLQ